MRVVLSPYRAQPARVEAQVAVTRELERVAPVFAADSATRAFSRAHALNEAARMAGDWTCAYVTDLDKIPCRLSQIREAFGVAERHGAYVVARTSLRYLTRKGTHQCLDGLRPCLCEYDEEVGVSWDDQFALRRDRWDEIGGFDERIVGYGGSGVAFAAAAGTLFGREMVEGASVHLRHPQVRGRRRAIDRNGPLVDRYRVADGDEAAMRALLAEQR